MTLYSYIQLRLSEISDKLVTESIGPSENLITLQIHSYYEKKNIFLRQISKKISIYITVKVKVKARHHRRRGLH